MDVFLVIQKDKPDSRVRCVFSTLKEAEEYIKTEQPMTLCGSCGQSRANPDYNPSDIWKLNSKIEKWYVLGKQ